MMMQTRRILSLLLVLTLFCLCPLSGTAAQPTWSQVLEQHIHDWIGSLATKDSQFAPWKEATTRVQALAPNSRQWMVTVEKAGKSLGYMVVTEERTEQARGQAPSPRFLLLEYGLGEYSLFDPSIAPKGQTAELVYDGFPSYWKVSDEARGGVRYVDAKTGEHYPTGMKPDPAVMPMLTRHDLIAKGQRLTESKMLHATEISPLADLSWLDGQAKATVVASLYQNQVIAPFIIGTLHVWNNTTYIGVWDEGLRFLPVRYIEKVGK